MKLLRPDTPRRDDDGHANRPPNGPAAGPTSGPAPSDDVLHRNLQALAVRSPEAARAIAAAPARNDCAFPWSDEDACGLVVGGRTLASRKRPVTEGERLAASVDPTQNAGVCLLGFGAGYHARSLITRLGRAGVVVCFEPDVGMLRAVFERVDHSAWIAGSMFTLIVDPDDRAGISRAIEGVEGLVALGMKIVEHPASAAHLGAMGGAFSSRFTEVVKATKTVVATTLARSGVTLRNLVMNADRYAAAEGIAPLAGCCAGRPAVVVSAGPSLARNVELLAQPGVRERVAIVAVQTVLKTLLSKGIKPHVVCALDHHEISTRFYEGLTAEDVEGVTLIADAKVNPAVLNAWPGRVRMPANELLDALLGEDAAAPKGELKPGATVAHLCHYVARHMGADPVVLIGQDLGFTDHQYYAAGAAIHRVWAGELGHFNTLESMEWQRIARAKRTLIPAKDALGRTIYTDEQMASYLAQFEVDFAADAALGLTVIDATEGGVAKQHTRTATLAEALGAAPSGEALRVPIPARSDLASVSARVTDRVRRAGEGARRIAQGSHETAKLLGKAAQAGGDVAAINRYVTRIHAIRDEVTAIEPAWRLVQFLDQNAALARIRADRSIELDSGLSAVERQQRQIGRDRENVERIARSAEELGAVLERAVLAITGAAPRITRTDGDSPTDAPVSTEGGRVEAVILADPEVSGTGIARDLARPIAGAVTGGMNALQLTVTRCLRAKALDGVCVCGDDVARTRSLLGELANNPRVTVETIDLERVRARAGAVGRARLFAHDAWRGGIGGLTCFDEALEPEMLAGVAERRELGAAVIVGCEWALVDPALIDACVLRWRAHPSSNKVVFTQAVPGAGPIVLERSAIATIRDVAASAGPFGSVGGMLGYVPGAPQHDPIATRLCVGVDPRVRDAGVRLIADAGAGVELVGGAIEALGDSWTDADALRIVQSCVARDAALVPQHLELELCTGRLISGRSAQWRSPGDAGERPVMSMPMAHGVLKQFAEARPDGALTLGGAGDPLMHARALDIVTMARELGIGAVHVRTSLARDGIDLGALATCGAGVVSVDVLAGTRETYRTLTGADRFEVVTGRVRELIELSKGAAIGGLPSPWVVARLTRCDEIHEELPDFYDAWMSAAGAVQIDPLPRAIPGSQVKALPVPTDAAERAARSTMTVRSDGRVVVMGCVSERSIDEAPLGELCRATARQREAPEVVAA